MKQPVTPACFKIFNAEKQEVEIYRFKNIHRFCSIFRAYTKILFTGNKAK